MGLDLLSGNTGIVGKCHKCTKAPYLVLQCSCVAAQQADSSAWRKRSTVFPPKIQRRSNPPCNYTDGTIRVKLGDCGRLKLVEEWDVDLVWGPNTARTGFQAASAE